MLYPVLGQACFFSINVIVPGLLASACLRWSHQVPQMVTKFNMGGSKSWPCERTCQTVSSCQTGMSGEPWCKPLLLFRKNLFNHLFDHKKSLNAFLYFTFSPRRLYNDDEGLFSKNTIYLYMTIVYPLLVSLKWNVPFCITVPLRHVWLQLCLADSSKVKWDKFYWNNWIHVEQTSVGIWNLYSLIFKNCAVKCKRHHGCDIIVILNSKQAILQFNATLQWKEMPKKQISITFMCWLMWMHGLGSQWYIKLFHFDRSSYISFLSNYKLTAKLTERIQVLLTKPEKREKRVHVLFKSFLQLLQQKQMKAVKAGLFLSHEDNVDKCKKLNSSSVGSTVVGSGWQAQSQTGYCWELGHYI